MRSTRTMVVVAALGALLALPAVSFADHDRDDHGYGYGYGYRDGDDGGRVAFQKGLERGYHEGREHGEKDGRHHDSFDFVHARDYRNADEGYHSSYGPRWAYGNGFRQGYERGYREAYRESFGYRDGHGRDGYSNGGYYGQGGGYYGQGGYYDRDGRWHRYDDDYRR